MMINNEISDRDEICGLIPHAGLMCLLDKVTQWDETHIVCYSNTHKDPDNPLRNNDILPMSALIEYGAQAMAVHGGLLAKASGKIIHEGYLAALRDVTIEEGDVSSIISMLCVEARQLMALDGNMIYNFSIKADEKLLASGRATVVAIYRD